VLSSVIAVYRTLTLLSLHCGTQSSCHKLERGEALKQKRQADRRHASATHQSDNRSFCQTRKLTGSTGSSRVATTMPQQQYCASQNKCVCPYKSDSHDASDTDNQTGDDVRERKVRSVEKLIGQLFVMTFPSFDRAEGGPETNKFFGR
jgi:hypothetical protein